MEKLKNSKSWKTRCYYQIIKNEPYLFKIKPYLKWKTSTTFLKFRIFSNGLPRYSYVFEKLENRNTKTKKK